MYGSILSVALAGVALAAPVALPGEAKLQALVEGRAAGTPVACVAANRLGQSIVIDGTAIVYRAGSRLYVNRPSGMELPSLNQNVMLVTRSPGAQICRNDIVDLVDRYAGVRMASIRLGDFQPYGGRSANR